MNLLSARLQDMTQETFEIVAKYVHNNGVTELDEENMRHSLYWFFRYNELYAEIENVEDYRSHHARIACSVKNRIVAKYATDWKTVFSSSSRQERQDARYLLNGVGMHRRSFLSTVVPGIVSYNWPVVQVFLVHVGVGYKVQDFRSYVESALIIRRVFRDAVL